MEPVTFDDIKDITIRSSELVKWLMGPDFEEVVVGCFVRIVDRRTNTGTDYRLLKVEGVDAFPNEQYMLDGETTHKYLKCVSSNGFTFKLRMDRVSDSAPLEGEFERWVREVESRTGRQILSKRDVLQKKEMLQETTSRYVHSEASSESLNIAVAKDQLRRMLKNIAVERDWLEATWKSMKATLEELEAQHQRDTETLKRMEMDRKN